ncbi:MAG TPA: four-helix bundle copper-binding protein [Hyphomicrobiaceae bacterium]|nr:four-helix bundle copper-binding protein [Hyphomicrobiaceae bacterium]
MSRRLPHERQPTPPPDASRRWLIAGAGALVAGVGLAGSAWGQGAAPKTSPVKSPHQAIIDATKRCETVGNVCLRHCVRLTRLGDKSLAECMRSVSAMLPICVATNKLATQDAKALAALAKVCADVCRECEAECRKHEFHHVECKRCAEACAATVKVLAAL